jgi:hypothetical protein
MADPGASQFCRDDPKNLWKKYRSGENDFVVSDEARHRMCRCGGSVWYDSGRKNNGRFIQPGKVHIGKILKSWKCALWKNHISANGTFCDFTFLIKVTMLSNKEIFGEALRYQ